MPSFMLMVMLIKMIRTMDIVVDNMLMAFNSSDHIAISIIGFLQFLGATNLPHSARGGKWIPPGQLLHKEAFSSSKGHGCARTC